MTKLLVGSAVNLTNQVMPGVLPSFLDEGAGQGIRMLGPGCAAADRMCDRFNNLMTLIDRDRYAGNEKDLFTYQPGSSPASSSTGAGKPKRDQQGRREHDHPKGQTTAVAAKVVSGSYFAKVELYANARLPMDLPPLKLYIPTWPLVCLAARYSERVYEKPRGKEKDVHVESDSRTGTKAMCIKSVPMDDMNTIVFAIRGTATFGDWTVNLKTEPVSPEGFLDDCGNYCHAGFLSVARRMVAPVAARLRQLLQENPTRRSSSLLITGHSAGGAVAALLYAHMHSTSLAARSELSVLTSGFKRVHCVTFGTPPVSLLPLQRPTAPEFRKSLFLSFVNEGDPVARADKAYVRSLLELFATPVPALAARTVAAVAAENRSRSAPALLLPNGPEPDPKKAKSRNSVVSTKSGSSSSNGKGSHVQAHKGPVWKVPPCTLSSAGRIVVLRSGDPKARLKGKKTVEERLNEGVVAQMTTDEQLRTQIWGDPVCHLMKLYAGRLEILAVNAVTANGY
ncbi:alpha/beta-hydrolase [Cryphonectria parasitica EP155]|uniref:Alpha/beta-hydrolase n=1 Tax=Cryphonectria parasitica (strain ATCC 38755 / EP155) TaxID=660469 RepID=A0A9P4YCU2_CRYP1|nr:alpha/beta-hydrolase [Cryphonectria parasitica EP155]KAF3771174.1 alpha/beta-hydrolase [Cryphonectria parasitica EP155]